VEKVICQQKDVFASFTERRQVKGQNFQPMIEVGTKHASDDGLLKVQISCRDDADIETPPYNRSQPSEDARLDHG
jgi:hypothetical protein